MNNMTRNILAALMLTCVWAAQAQPFNLKKASKAVFAVKTFAQDGTLLGSTNGFFVGTDGVGVSSYAPFKGASSAVVIDAQNKEWPVELVLGANASCDVVRFRTGARKVQGLTATATAAGTGNEVWLLHVGARRTVEARHAVVRRVETVAGSYAYYSVAADDRKPVADGGENCPLLGADGSVVGILQASATPADTLAYAVDMRLADSLRMTGLSINDDALRQIHIKKALPEQLDQAQLTLFVARSAVDSAAYATLVDDFIRQFPQSSEGYEYRAQLKLNANDFAGAQADMDHAVSVAEKKDEAHLAYSRLILQKEIYKAQMPYEPWSLGKSLDEARKAYELNPLPIYMHQQASVLFTKKDYEQASALYRQLAATPLRSADLFVEAARCSEMMRDTLGQLALLDSAVNVFSRPYLQEAAPFLLARAQARLAAGRYRDAVTDLNDCEQLWRSQLSAQFYYVRFQAEVGGRLFQPALNDISKAIEMDSQNEVYYAERASLQVRVGLLDDAMETARQCISVAPEGSDGYLFLGLAQCLKGLKAEGLQNLQKASELGDPQAAELIAKYAQ